MRWIDYDVKTFTFPTEWIVETRIARKIVVRAPLNQKNNMIEKYQNWRSLKPSLLPIFNNKCWYSETPQVGTDTDIDHFRPKNRVHGVQHHKGYWWLAFDPSNYRVSCIVSNRRRKDLVTDKTGGKADYFPLVDEEKRIYLSQHNLCNERPILLDPCNQEDVKLITFSDDGMPMSVYSEEENEIAFNRVDRSISLYHLDHHTFVKARTEIRDRLSNSIQEAKLLFPYCTDIQDIKDAYEIICTDLKKSMILSAPFSSFAIAYLEKYKHDDDLRDIFN